MFKKYHLADKKYHLADKKYHLADKKYHLADTFFCNLLLYSDLIFVPNVPNYPTFIVG